MSSIRDKIGLDYLFDPPEPRVETFAAPASQAASQFASSSGARSQIDAALLAVGGRIMGALADCPDRRGLLYDLVDTTGITIEPMLGAVLKLESLGLIRIGRRDPKGNHQVELTDEGVAAFRL